MPMKPQVAAWELGQRLRDDAIVSCDSGALATWWARHIQCVAFVGDGGCSMLMAEFANCVKHKLPVKVVIIKNNVLGQIKRSPSTS